ncbi:hypothetical protein BBD42_13120 [Paenibacillus sp. BIHB 4019]|uniref:Uncharacterized protein n=1 Tax=Paenibacillus sp. BIHB 4019 TaxID=1870819 RepID=A0A1B2DHW0_9BACL|nr:hypothetical protein [Paenibacillus sp. BIHB 4019]ANY67310.1 hypothetical protein BBD42_13120 [Paenibacillus sp. BIHB 4019]
MPPVKKGTHSEAIGIKKLGSAPVDYMTNLISVSVTIDPASMATVTGALTAGITATGAALGDRVALFPPPQDTQGITYFGYVSAANTVRISFFNPTAGTIDLASGEWTIHVIRK